MKVSEMTQKLNLTVYNLGQDHEITGGYAGDLLSWVMGRVEEGNVWLTVQVHLNVVAVAVLKECSAILLCDGAKPSEEMLAKAQEEGLTILGTDQSIYHCAKEMGALGL